ncbi:MULTISPECIES: DUF732 domain-containing protein [unclassified Gordonia (in: high G+C Gram-positive bacteria)]|uniref:DUF732 domain-containing protein n=1 Tax=unclassified Gordonia (in: high G+C Gram-positive bacteria) TaxID=2657482 RepID=UPI001F0E5CDD|nr:DUF732 domain-containing protein [Gordonia sp. ABSL49_1]MCH5643371.1 DUF732 domain-containing protein [Gordonia sp. ABSL49_1]
MTRPFVSTAVMAVGLVLTLGSITACGDDSTASAPITGNPVTTTSLLSGADSSTTAANPSASATLPNSSTPGGQLPATGPNPSTTVPSNYPGPSGAPLSEKARRYLAALKAQNVTFMGDSDNSVALTMAEYVCGARAKGTDPTTVKAFVTASVGPGTKTVEEANAKADKVIAAAADNYC